jgi:hypothetical protein
VKTPAITVAVLVLLTSLAIAQQPPRRPHRGGLWGEFGFGPGHVRVACSGCDDVRTANGATSYLRIGGTVSDDVMIGVEIFSLLDRAFSFSPEDSVTSAETATIALIVTWFPGRRGLFLKGGVGAAAGQYSLPTGPAQADTSTGGGIGLTFGVGWDASISRKFAITGNAGVYVTAVGDVELPGRRVDDVIATMYHVSIGFTFR